MAAFGDLLSELRRDMKMTQDELAKVLFVSPGTISNYENNIHIGSMSFIPSLFLAFL